MLRFILRRVLWAIPTLFLVTFLVFVAIRIGTDPVAAYRGACRTHAVSPEQILQYRQQNGLIGSVPEQYFRWLGKFVTGDWGRSIVGSRPVWPSMKQALANTAVLGLFASTLGITIGLSIGVLSALKQHSIFDNSASTGAFVGLSIPPFVSAILLQLIFVVYWQRWFGESPLPTSGVTRRAQGLRPVPAAKHLVLPVTVVAIQTIAIYSRYMRASMLEVLNSDYLRTARAKGIQRAAGDRAPRDAQRPDPASRRSRPSTSARSSAA